MARRIVMPALCAAAMWGTTRLLIWGTAEPLRAVRSGTAGLNELLGLAAALAAWAVLAWVAAVLVCTAVAALPGTAGRVGARVSHRLAPAAARSAARLAVGLAVTAGPVAAAPAAVGLPATVDGGTYTQVVDISELPGVGRPGEPVPPGNAREPDTSTPAPDPGAAETPPTPDTQQTAETPPPPTPGTEQADEPGAAPPGAAPPGAAQPGAAQPDDAGLVTEPTREDGPGEEIVVKRGDSLWAIAARHLGPSATTADIAAEWPRWYAANRSAIGDDPDLILPGTILRPPLDN